MDPADDGSLRGFRTKRTLNPMTNPSVTVVIPTFNRARELERALEGLEGQSVGSSLRVIVVDNSSTDSTRSLMEALVPRWDGRLTYIVKEPEGPASARNVGLAAADTPYVLFQDSDIELPPEWVERALAHIENEPDLAGVGGYIMYGCAPDRVNAYGGDLGLLGLAWDLHENSVMNPATRAAERIWINCSAMLVRTAAVVAVGAFDERFFYGYEDSDLGWRLNLAGFRLRVFPDLKARHHVEADPGAAHPQIVFHYCKNRLRSILKNSSATWLPLMLAGYLAYATLDLLLRGPRGGKLRALRWNIAHLGETIAMRRFVQRRRAIPDRTVFGRGSTHLLPPSPLAGRRRRPLVTASAVHALHGAPARDDRI